MSVETGKTTTEPAGAAADPKEGAGTQPPAPKPEGEPKKEAAADGKPVTKGPEGGKTDEPKFDLKLPEGSHLDAGAVEKHTARAKELKLTPEQAQADLNRESELLKTYVEGQQAQLAKTVDTWVEEAKKDPEIGGEGFAKSAETAMRVVNRFGTEEFKKALNETGLGNHPELIRVLTRIGRAMTEDQLVLPTGQPKGPKSAEDVLYGESSNKEK